MLLEDCQHKNQTVSGASGYDEGERAEEESVLPFDLLTPSITPAKNQKFMYIYIYIMQPPEASI